MICDGLSGQEIDFIANSGAQARLGFDMAKNFAESLDPNRLLFQRYRDSITLAKMKSKIQVLNSDSMTLDGLGADTFIEDELHAAKNWDLHNVLKSSQGYAKQPLAIVCTTAGFLLDGYPLYEMRQGCIDILEGRVVDDSQFSALYELDENDDWRDPDLWIKANPSLGVTVTKEYLADQVQQAINNPSLEVGVKTKNFNMFCGSSETWIAPDTLRKNMRTLKLEDFRGCYCYAGVDLASVSDLTALSIMIPKDGHIYFFSWAFVPEDTYNDCTNSGIYSKFKRMGHLMTTPGNVTDYDYLLEKINEINRICPIQQIFYDSYNATQFAINTTNAGYEMEPYSQALGNYNRPTKEFERLLLSDKVTMDYNECVLWCFNNSALKYDGNANAKPYKGGGVMQKIDCVISMLTALGGYLNNPTTSSEIYII